MPVECKIERRPVGQEQFRAVDTLVMRDVVDIQKMILL